MKSVIQFKGNVIQIDKDSDCYNNLHNFALQKGITDEAALVIIIKMFNEAMEIKEVRDELIEKAKNYKDPV
jgi:hypothetical protein